MQLLHSNLHSNIPILRPPSILESTQLDKNTVQLWIYLFWEYVENRGKEGRGRFLIIKALPIPAGTVEAGRDEEDDQEGDEEAERHHAGRDGPDEGPLREVNHGRAQGHPDPAGPLPVLGRIAGQVEALHAQGAHQARPHVTQPVEGVLAVVRAHAALTWRER